MNFEIVSGEISGHTEDCKQVDGGATSRYHLSDLALDGQIAVAEVNRILSKIEVYGC